MEGDLFTVQLFKTIKTFLLLFFLTTLAQAQYVPFAFHAVNTGSSSNKHYYVSSAGSDLNNGLSPGAPFQTLNKISTLDLNPYDTVSFKGGETIYGSYSRTDTNFFSSGSGKIVFNSYGTGKATLRPNSLSDDKHFYLQFTGTLLKYEFKSLIFRGYYIAETGVDSLNQYGLYVMRTGSSGWNDAYTGSDMYLVVDSCEFTGYETTGLTLLNRSFYIRGYFRVTNNNFHDLGLFGYNGEGMCHSDFKIDYNSFTNIHGKANNTGPYDYVYGFRQIFSKKFSASYNYVNNLGKYSSGACGLYTSASVSVKFSRNEVRNVVAPTFAEGVGIYPDCNTDSILVENNYIQNCYTGVFGSAGFSGGCGPPGETGVRGFAIDSTGSYGNIVRYNIIVSDSTGRNGVILYSADSTYRKFPKNNFIYNNLIYAKSGYKNLDTAAGRYITAGILQTGWQESLYVYNNIFVLDSAHAFDTQPTTYNNGSGRNLNATIKNNLYYTVNGDSDRMNSYVKNGWTMTTSFHWYRLVYPSLMVWADSTGYEKSGVNYLYTHADPKIKNVLARLYGTTAKINPVYLDTLTNFKAQMYSAAYIKGVNYNSVVKRFGDTSVADFYGAAIKYPAPDIGINNIPAPSGTGGDTTNYYVDDAAGNDSYSGNSAAYPFKTLSKIKNTTLDPGDSIFFKGGQTFHGSLSYIITYEDTVNALTFTSYGTGKPTILLGTGDSIGIDIYFTKHIKLNIRNIKVSGIYNSATETGGFNNYQVGISVRNWAITPHIDSNRISQITIANCEISNLKSGGIVVTPGDYGKTFTCKIDSNLVYDCGITGIGMNFNWHSRSRIYGNVIRDIRGMNAQYYSTAISISLCKDIAIERNLIYNIGQRASWSGLGINIGASKNIKTRYNEIYTIFSNTNNDAEAIDLENGSDSCLVEYNYIHSTPGMGVLISSNTSKTSIVNNYKMYATLRGSIDSGSADYNIVRYNLMKNLSSTNYPGLMAIKIATGGQEVSIPGKNNQVYNNTIIYPYRRTAGAYSFVFNGRSDSTKFFNNLIIGDSLLNILHDTLVNKTNTFINNNIYWDRGKTAPLFANTTSGYVAYANIYSFNSTTTWENSRLLYNPLLVDPYTVVGDTLNNPWLIENLRSRYTPTQGSIVTSLGANITNYIRTAPTTDISGAAAQTAGAYGIGAFNDTTNYGYTFQLETKRLLSRDTNLISQADKYIKDSLILGLKTDTLWSKMEAFYILATPNEFSGKLNAIKDSGNMVMAGTIQFFPYEGFKNNGNGGYGYLNSFFGFGTGALYTLDNASIGVYSRTDSLGIGRTVSNQYEIFATSSGYYTALRLNTNTSNYVSAWINDGNFGNVINNGSTAGLFTSNRVAASGSGAVVVYKNGTSIGTISSTASVIPNANFCIFGAPVYGAPNDSNVSRRQLSFAFFGAALTASQNINLTNRVEAYLDRYGKGTITDNRAYYVDAVGGNDGNTGTIGSPYQTISKVNSLILTPGDTVKFKGGTTFTDTTLIIGEAGTAIAPIVFTSYNGSRATFTRSLDKGIYLNNGVGGIVIRSLNINGNYNSTAQTGSDTSTNHVGILASDFNSGISSPAAIMIDSVTITGFKQSGINIGADTSHGFSTITIKNSEVSSCGIDGINLWGLYYKTILVQNNKIYDIKGRSGTGSTVNYGYSGIGIELANIRSATMTRNLIYNNGANTYYGTYGIRSTLSKKLIADHNEIYGIKSSLSDGNAISFISASDSCIAEHNYLHNNAGSGISISGTSGTGAPDYNIIRYNILKNNGLSNNNASILVYQDNGLQPTGNIIQNNTIVLKKISSNIPIGIYLKARKTVSTRIKNNIILGDSTTIYKLDSTGHTTLYIQGNCYWDRANFMYSVVWGTTTYTDLYTWQNATGQEKNGATSVILKFNPFLKNPRTYKDTINNPYTLDTLTNYKFIEPSLMKNLGVKSDSSYLWSANATDYFGQTVPKQSLYDVGAYEDTLSTPAYAYLDESKRWLGRHDTLQTAAQMQLKDSLIKFLKADTLFSKMDIMYVLANLDSGSAKVNVIKDTFNITTSVPVTFTTQEGYTGNNSTMFLNTNYSPSTNGIQYQTDSASLSIYSMTTPAYGVAYLGANNAGVNFVRFSANTGGDVVSVALNGASVDGSINSTGMSTIGLFTISKNASNSIKVYKNDTLLNTISPANSEKPSVPITILASNGNGSPNNWSSVKTSFVQLGNKLNSYNIHRMTDNIEWYLNRIGTAKVPLKPFLLSPASAVTVTDSDTTLSWSALNNRSSYHLQVSTAANFGSFFKNDSGLTSTTYNLTGLIPSTTYYWRVRAKNSAGVGSWSLTNNFTTSAALAATYYVDSLAGNDGNAGTTVGSPWKTLSKVQSYTFKYGDTIKFKAPYIYTGNINKKDSVGTAQLTNISFDSYGTGKATILATDGLPAMNFISRLENSFKVSVRNLKLEGTYVTATQSGGHYWNDAIHVEKPDSMPTVIDSVNFLKVTNCEMKKFGWGGVVITVNDVRRNFSVKLDSNLIFDCGETGITGNGIWKPSSVVGNTIYNIRGRNGAYVTLYTLPLFMSYCKNILISRNLVYNSGHNASAGSALIAVSGSRNCIFSYNETYGAIGYTEDGDGLDLDVGSDSCIVEYNYSHNNDAAGLLISGNDYRWDAFGYRINKYGDEWYLKDSSGSDYNIVRYNVFKNNNRKLNYGDVSFYSELTGKSMKGNKIYNNTFIQSKKSSVTNASMIRYIGSGGYDSTRIFNNVFLGDSILFMKSDVNNTLHYNTTITNNIFWDSLNTYKNVYWNSSVITLASWFSTYGYESAGSTALQYNPFLKNPWTTRDTINNPYKLDTLSAYKKIYGPSVITDLGRNFDSVYAYSLTNYALGTKDFYGSNLKLNNKYDIGAYEDTATYIWQDTTKYWTGAITKHFNSDTLVYYDSLILRLQTDSIMRDTRLLYMFYAPDTALAYRSLKLEDTLATKSGGLTFTPYGGITNNGGTNSGLNLNLRPNSTDGIYTSVNSAFGILVTTNVIENNFDVGSYKISYPIAYWGLRTRYSSLPNQIINNHNNDWPQQAMLNNNDSSSKGFYLSSRFGSGDTLKTFKNGLLLDRTISKDSILPNYYITVGGIRYETPTISENSNKNYASFWSGRGLSNYRQAKLNEHLNWFLTRIGKPNYTDAFRDASAIFSSGSKGFRQFPYTPVQYYNDTLRMYYFDDSTRIATSLDGINWTTKKTFTGGKYVQPYETVIRMNGSSTNYKMLEHTWAGGNPVKTRIFNSTDRGFTFTLVSPDSVVLVGGSDITGEDIGGIIYNSDSSKYNIYIRPKIAPDHSTNAGYNWEEWAPFRKISLIKTSDFITFSSSYKPQLPVDTNQYYNVNSKDYHKAFYSMSVIKTASDEWWSFINVLKVDDSTRDVYDQGNPGGGWEKATDNTVEVQLAFSKDGENWVRCNDSLAILPLRNGKKQIYGIPTIVGNEVWIYAFEAQFRHVLHDPLTATTYWEIWRYRMSIGDLRKFKKYY